MLKNSKKVLATILALTMSVGLTACGDNDEDTLLISAFNGGYGLAWLNAIVEEYKKDNPDVKIDVRPVTKRENQVEEIKSERTKYDLYITGTNLHAGLYEGMKLADLSDVYTNIEATGTTMNPTIKAYYEHEGSYYGVPWATAMLGILYHENVYTEYKLNVPRTTDQLFENCETINTMRGNNEKGYPFVYCLDDNYTDYLYKPWFAQYECATEYAGLSDYTGMTHYENYYNCIAPTGEQYSSDVVYYTGIKRMLQVYETMLKPSNQYNHPESKTVKFTEVQGDFINGTSVMMINGDWAINELMKSGKNTENAEDIKFMRLPIISSIVEQLSFWEEAEGVEYFTLDKTTKKAYDDKLAQIVADVDAGKTSSTVGSAQDFTKIKNARSILPTMACYHEMIVPEYSNKVEEAKDFIEYVYSAKGIQLYADNVYGSGLPVEYTAEQIAEITRGSKLLQSAYDMFENAYLTFHTGGKGRVFSQNGLSPVTNGSSDYFTTCFVSESGSWRSANDFYTEIVNYVTPRWENEYMRNVSF